MKKTRLILIVALVASLGILVPGKAAVSQQTAGELFEKALYVEEGQGDLQKAIGFYQDIVKKFTADRETAAKALLHIGICYEKLGLAEAQKAFQKVVSDFPEQKEAVTLARDRLSRLSAAKAALEKGGGEIRIRKVWDNAIDSFFTGVPSPDGRYLTYVDWENFANLGIRDLVKGENRQLTGIKSWEGGEMCYYSVFSPDGGQIAYSWQTKEMLNQLRAVNLDGSSTRILLDAKDVSYQVPIGWTADGKQILTVLFGKDNSSRIVFVSSVDGSVKVLKPMSFKPGILRSKMSLSPDGRYIAYSYPPREDSSNADIFLLSTEAGQESTLVDHPADESVLGWSPDGGQVIFTSDRTGSIGIWAVRVSDGKAQGMPELVRGDMNLRPLGMTRDGKLYYGIYTGWSDIFIAAIDPVTGRVLASPAKAVRKYETFNSAPDWSPDGQFLVCRSSRGRMAGESPSLLVRSLRTNEVREVNPKKGGGLNFHYIRWSPDGRSVLGIGYDENGKYGALLSIDVQSGETKIIVRSDKDDPVFAPNWAPDGKTLYFLRSGKEFRRIMKFDLETGAEKEIFRARQGLGTFWLMISPDGQQLAVAAENKIKIISSDGAESRELMENKDVTTIAWMADGKSIIYGKLQDGSQDVADLWRVPAAGGEPQKLGLAMSRLMHLRVSPDGESIAFTASEQPGKTEVWVMENFLPPGKK
jgi:Tol biopolymer transport system component